MRNTALHLAFALLLSLGTSFCEPHALKRDMSLPSYFETPSERPVLMYWGIRGLAQPIRNLLKYKGVAFDEVTYTDPDKWFGADKPVQPVPFPNLPAWFDTNGVKIVQSGAIFRHLGRKYGLLGTTEAEMAIVDMCFEQVVDWKNAIVSLSCTSILARDAHVRAGLQVV